MIYKILFKSLGKIIIKIIIILALFLGPIVALVFKLHYPNFTNSGLLLFIFLLAIERTWETFYSSRERRGHKLYGDWTLPLVSIAYIILALIVICEFFLKEIRIDYRISFVGFFIFISAFILRIWGMRTLKEQWTVHAIGAQKVKNVFLIKSGPYKYIRHPIYLGVILEVLSIPLIWNTYFAFIFAVTINVPLQVIRAYFEEKTSIKKLGKEFISYKKEVPAFLPIKFFRLK